MVRRPPGSTRTYTLFPDTLLFLSRSIPCAVGIVTETHGCRRVGRQELRPDKRLDRINAWKGGKRRASRGWLTLDGQPDSRPEAAPQRRLDGHVAAVAARHVARDGEAAADAVRPRTARLLTADDGRADGGVALRRTARTDG